MSCSPKLRGAPANYAISCEGTVREDPALALGKFVEMPQYSDKAGSDTHLIKRRAFVASSSLALGSMFVGSRSFLLTEELPDNSRTIEAAQGVLRRSLGARADNFDLMLMPTEGPRPAYEFSATGGRVKVRGSSAVALCRGAYSYLRDPCQAMITWSGRHLNLPPKFPDAAATYVVCPYEYVQYLNPCTFGYTTAFWGWDRWERELDWMALHGVTMALALEGQEAIWQRVWLQMGVTQAELDRHFTGPAQLPWHRMGNINNFDGPLPQSWIDGHRHLQHRILDRMRELGIAPIVPGFSGFVPQGFKRLHPEIETFTEMWHSTEVPHLSKTFILDPRVDHMYQQIGRLFIQQYKQEFGPVKYYLVDTFNELSVPVSADRRYDDLARFAQSVFGGIRAGDPDGVWVMQGWLFRDNPGFWDDRSVKAFLSRVPDDRMIILDYSNDSEARNKDAALDPTKGNIWKRDLGFHGKRWVDGMLHTFGGNNNVKGNLALLATQPYAARTSVDHGRLIGWSMDPEGIENNEVVYELMTDVGWRSETISLDHWIASYCKARYGEVPPAMKEAWQLLLQSAYSRHTWNSRQAWQSRPTLEPAALDVDAGPIFQTATERFLSCAPLFRDNVLYRNDLIEVVVQVAGGSVDKRLAQACASHKDGRSQDRDRQSDDALQMLLLMDGLLNVREDRRLERWVDDARAWGTTPDIKAYYDISARRLITYWGWPDLNDYAARVWSGLTRDYYAGRWKEFFRALKAGETAYFDKWEESWLSTPYKPSAPTMIWDVAEEASRMLSICREWH